MKRYITAVVASAGLVLGTLSAFAADPNDPNQPADQQGRAIDRSQVPATTDAQSVNTTTPAPIQDEPGRQFDRARLNNPAGGYAVNEPAGSDNDVTTDKAEHASMKAKAVSPSGFIMEAYEGDQAEVRFGQLAQEKASSDQVKALGQRLVTDHQAHADKVQQLAQQKNIQVSNQLSAKCQKKLDELSALNGAAFDKRYVRDMVKDHKKDIAFYEQAAANNTDPDVKALAQSTLPTLKEHLQMAERHGEMREPAGAAMDNTSTMSTDNPAASTPAAAPQTYSGQPAPSQTSEPK